MCILSVFIIQTYLWISEIARMYSVSCTILREATTNYNVPNQSLVIEKGQKIIIPMYNIHNDPEYYPNPEVFDPERFSTEQKFKRLNGTFFPFGDGPRMCIGITTNSCWYIINYYVLTIKVVV